MKKLFVLVLCASLFGCSRTEMTTYSKSRLLGQLRNSYTNKDWFVPLKIAVKDLSIEKVNWKDSSDNHSIGELVSHLIFWNERVLIAFQGDKVPDFDDNNKTTFVKYSGKDWENNLLKLDSIQTKWEQVISEASNKQLIEWNSSVANMCSHTAYHTGQIIYIRKRNGWWNELNTLK